MYNKKRAFNERMLSLKFKKSDVLDEIDRLNEQLQSIHTELKDIESTKRAPERPTLADAEKPEEFVLLLSETKKCYKHQNMFFSC